MGNWKRLLLGEPMPDKNDPKYKDRYEREVEAGRKFANAVGLTWLAAKTQALAEKNKKLFLAVIFGIVLLLFIINIARLFTAYSYQKEHGIQTTAVERLDSVLYSTDRFKDNP